MSELDLPFLHDAAEGLVHVDCVPVRDPDAQGTLPLAREFPACTATVTYERRGYDSMFGWVQLVRSTDNASRGKEFELDPLALFTDLHTPFCWYGTTPTLFDAPWRLPRQPNDWLAHSFLAATPARTGTRPVVPVVGFSWGFDIDDRETVTLKTPSRLHSPDWGTHLPVLRTEFPTWTFEEAQLDL